MIGLAAYKARYCSRQMKVTAIIGEAPLLRQGYFRQSGRRSEYCPWTTFDKVYGRRHPPSIQVGLVKNKCISHGK